VTAPEDYLAPPSAKQKDDEEGYAFISEGSDFENTSRAAYEIKYTIVILQSARSTIILSDY